jgi:hypothetical protein
MAALLAPLPPQLGLLRHVLLLLLVMAELQLAAQLLM